MSIIIDSLTKKFGDQIAVNNISFTVNKGEIVGFLGPNGSGKSTTMKCLCGILPPNKGTIKVAGINIQENILEVKKHIGYLPENNPLNEDMYVKEYLSHIDGFYASSKDRSERVKRIIEMTGLEKEQQKKIGQLSKGYRQRVGLAQAMIHNPDVLILDEPTTGLDPNQIVEVRSLISSFSKDKTVLLSTHILQEVEAICDRILLLNQGNLVADGTAASIKTQKDRIRQTIFLEFSKPIALPELERLNFLQKVEQISATEFLVEGIVDGDLRELLFDFAANQKISLLTLQKKEETLEEAFRKLTQSN